MLSECMCACFRLLFYPLPQTSSKELGCVGRWSSPHLVISLIFSCLGKKRRPEGKIEGATENLSNHHSAEQLRSVRLWDPLFLIPLTPLPRTRWQDVRLKLWLPCLALSTAWVLSRPLSVSIYSLFKKGFERKLGMEQEKSSKLDSSTVV